MHGKEQHTCSYTALMLPSPATALGLLPSIALSSELANEKYHIKNSQAKNVLIAHGQVRKENREGNLGVQPGVDKSFHSLYSLIHRVGWRTAPEIIPIEPDPDNTGEGKRTRQQ